MISKVLELIINTKQAENALQGVDKGVQRIDNDLTKTEQEFQKVNKDADQLNKNISKVPNSTTKVVKGVKKIGIAIKGIGIGLLISGVAVLKDLFQSNQKIVDAFSIAFEGLSLAFNDFFNFISDNVSSITGFFKSIFEDPIGKLQAFNEAIEQNIINRINAAIDVFGFLSEAVVKFFNRDFDGALESSKKAGSSFVDMYTGVPDTINKVGDAIDSVSETFTEGTKSITEYTKSTFEAAKNAVELKNASELAMAANQGLIEKFDRQAEQQRQIRDDERKSLKERKEANDELGLILEKQQTSMLKNAQISLAAAKADLRSDKDSVEGKKAVMEAENELAAVRAQIEGFRSEQLINAASLEREELEMKNSKLAAENRISIERKKIAANQEETNLQRLEQLKKIDEQEREIELKRLQNVIDNANAGTQAKIDAEIAFNDAKLQFDKQALERQKEINDEEINLAKQKAAEQKQLDDQELANQKALQDAKFQLASSALNSISALANLIAQGNEERARAAFNINKAVGIAQVGINTSQAIMKAAAETTDFTPPQALRVANMVAMGVAGAIQIASIASQKFQPQGGNTPPPSTLGGGIGGGALGTAASQPANFNVVGQSGFNQISQAIQQQGPVQAFVVGSEVTTQQQLDNAIVSTATLGN